MTRAFLFAIGAMLVAVAAFATEPAPTPLRVAYPAEGTIMSAQIGLILEKTDVLRRHGFDAQVKAMGTGRELKTALVSGKADVIFTSQTNFVLLLGSGFESDAIHSLGSAGRMALVARDGGIRSVGELAGKKVATIFGTSIHQPLLEWLDEAGIRSGTQVIDMPSMAAMQAALLSGAIQAIMTWDPYLMAMEKKGGYRILRQTGFELITVGSRSFTGNRDVVQRFEDAVTEAVAYFSKHQAEVNGWFASMSRLDPAVIEDSSRLNRNYRVSSPEKIDLSMGEALVARLEQEGRFLKTQGYLSRPPDIRSHLCKPASGRLHCPGERPKE